jgi:peptidoglycan/LPS O-acetylase OafA/YrhL
MVFAILVGASDIRSHPLAYFLHVSNWHIALMPDWPSGTSHYWTLAIQMQFYLLWPLLVFLAPRRTLGWCFGLAVLAAPICRWIIDCRFPQIHHSEAVTGCAMDHFGCGALLALAIERGMSPGDRRLGWLATASFVVYAVLYVFNEAGMALPIACHFQQTLLAVAFAGLISRTMAGFSGGLGRVLDHPAVQHVARLNYGLYLLHSAAPLLVGLIIP